jgi:hypothetical protein
MVEYLQVQNHFSEAAVVVVEFEHQLLYVSWQQVQG